MRFWFDAKWWLVDATLLSKDALHVHIGLALLLLAAWVTQRAIGSRVPLLLVLAAALVNEAADILYNASVGDPLRPFANLKDVANTMLWPGIATLIARRWRRRSGDRGERPFE